jgi:hypothetical protein
MRRAQGDKEALELSGTHQPRICEGVINLLGIL